MPSFEYQDQPIYYVEHGEAAGRPPLVLVHGAGGTHLHWPPQVRRLPGERVLALDLPGHGQSLPPGGRGSAPLTDVDAMAAAVLALVDHLRLERAVVVGHSMGGAVALTLALHHPERVAGLGLVGTGARLRVMPELLARLAADFAGAVDLIILSVFGPAAPEQLTRLARARMLMEDPRVLLADWQACNAFDVRERLGGIGVPVLVITGTEDRMTPEKYARFLAERLPQADLRLVAGAGHMVMLERPVEVAQEIGNWVIGNCDRLQASSL
jgi:pimeloyl-ACP methyl ester carboxylesterase